MGSGWFPSRPRDRGKGYCNVISKKDDLEEGEIEEDDVESDPEEDASDSEEESEEESTDDDDNDHDHLCSNKEGIEVLHAYVPSCFTKMFNVMMKHGRKHSQRSTVRDSYTLTTSITCWIKSARHFGNTD
ncbi:unnamed protein product [Aureobasidium pullulans]|nr:unnamed protein product [Aureobasidium pullulans]CAD0042994.1 unnamed protein product [Aureobasidium pullulans]CAD0043002.1 unnamed protein product [Aureobasidium pullulans]CAD0051550.1 unnamed protein product [Aureobasidium pullulans]